MGDFVKRCGLNQDPDYNACERLGKEMPVTN